EPRGRGGRRERRRADDPRQPPGPDGPRLGGRHAAAGRPAGLGALVADPGALTDAERPLDLPELHAAVAPAVAAAERGAVDERGGGSADGPADGSADASGPASPVAAATRWWRGFSPGAAADLPDSAQLANAMERVIAEDASVVRIEDLAGRLGVS